MQPPKVSQKIEEEAAAFEMLLNKSNKTDDKFLADIKSKLHKPQSLKEYIVFSEILGKPKALRR